MYVDLEIAALFPHRAPISKHTIIWTPSRRSYIILALNYLLLVADFSQMSRKFSDISKNLYET